MLPSLSSAQWTILGVTGVLILLAYQKGLFSKTRTREIDATQFGTVTQSNAALTNKANYIRELCMSSYNWTSSTAYENMLDELNALSNSNLVALANEYGRLYANEDYNTLKTMIGSVSMPFNFTAGSKRDALVLKMSQLGI